MKIPDILHPLLLAAPATAAAATAPISHAPLALDYIFENPTSPASAGLKIPTSYESAVMARRILALTPTATFSTVFPEGEPRGLADVPIGLSDYIADCEDDDGVGNPTILRLQIGTSFRNVRHGSNISVSLAWVPPYPPRRRIKSATAFSSSSWTLASFFRSLVGMRDAASEADTMEQQQEEEAVAGRRDPMPYSGANLPRFALLGYLEKIEHSKHAAVAACYVKTHPDAKYWLPGNPIHESEWVRLVVTRVYWIGGFGDRAYIGWIPVDEYKRVTRDEWETVRLPGEKPGWKEWSAEGLGEL